MKNNPPFNNSKILMSVLSGLGSALAGGAATGLVSKTMRHDEDDPDRVNRDILYGALLSGIVGASLPFGMSLLKPNSFSEQQTKPMIGRFVDSVTGKLVSNPAKSLLGAYGVAKNYKSLFGPLPPIPQSREFWNAVIRSFKKTVPRNHTLAQFIQNDKFWRKLINKLQQIEGFQAIKDTPQFRSDLAKMLVREGYSDQILASRGKVLPILDKLQKVNPPVALSGKEALQSNLNRVLSSTRIRGAARVSLLLLLGAILDKYFKGDY